MWQPAAGRLAHHDVSHLVLLGCPRDHLGQIRAALDDDPRAEPASQRQIVLQHRVIAGRLALRWLDMDGDQLAAEGGRQLPRALDQPLRGWIVADADHHPDLARPG